MSCITRIPTYLIILAALAVAQQSDTSIDQCQGASQWYAYCEDKQLCRQLQDDLSNCNQQLLAALSVNTIQSNQGPLVTSSLDGEISTLEVSEESEPFNAIMTFGYADSAQAGELGVFSDTTQSEVALDCSCYTNLQAKYAGTKVSIGPDLQVSTVDLKPRPYSRRLLQQGNCKVVDGFTFYPTYDSKGSEMYSMPTLRNNVPVLSAACGKLSGCNAFSTLGSFKSVVQPMASWTSTNTDSCGGLYVRNTPAACPAVVGYTFYPGLDASQASTGSPLFGQADDPLLLAASCTSNPSCKAFTTNGIVRIGDLGAPSTWSTWTKEPCKGMYVRNDAGSNLIGYGPVVSGEKIPSGVRRIGAVSSDGTQTLGSAGAVQVAIVDTGIWLNHTDLVVGNGTSLVSGVTSPNDDNGHGTHCAGIVGAKNNGVGIVGVAPGTTVVPVKVFGASGGGLMSTVTAGLVWIAANYKTGGRNIKVVSMSLGGASSSIPANCGLSGTSTVIDPMHKAICNLIALNITVVAAAGNSGGPLESATPAKYPEVLTVTAFADSDGKPGSVGGNACGSYVDDQAAGFSNYANSTSSWNHTIAAPGACINSTWRGSNTTNSAYQSISGTSMATPHVAGVVALCYGAGSKTCANKTPREIISYIRGVAQAHNSVAKDGFIGDPSKPIGTKYYGYMVWPKDL